MTTHFFSSMAFSRYFKPQFKLHTVVFVAATIFLHFMFLQSAAWRDWAPKSQPAVLSSVQVNLHPSLVPPEVAPAVLPPSLMRKTTAKARAPTKSVPTPVEPIPIPAEAPVVAAEVVDPAPTVEEASAGNNAVATALEAEINDAKPEFALRIPESVEMQMEVTHTKPNASPMQGVGSLRWDTYNGKYQISMEVGINLMVTTLNLYTLTSEGDIDAYGLAPIKSVETRRARAATAIHFNRHDRNIVFSSSNKTIKLENGVQDVASVLIQLTSMGYANPSQLAVGREFVIHVAEGRDATAFAFQVDAEEEIESPLMPQNGKLMTVHISRPPRPGSYNSRLDIWLAPSLGWYPIQIRNTESNGTVTNQIITSLRQKINMEK